MTFAARLRTALKAADALPPREPFLVEESRIRGERAPVEAEYALRGMPRGVTDAWPDPHGLDPVVFGTVPRVWPLSD